VASDVNILAAFGGGMISFLSPCVLPLVPGYLSLMSGVSVAELAEPATAADGEPGTLRTKTHVLRATLLFVAGFTLVFTLLGMTASAIGTSLLDHRVGLNRVAGVIVIIMGLFLAGFVSSPRLMAERRLHVSPSALGAWAPPVMGMAFAFGWTPCIGPILGGVLALASNGDSIGRGAVLLISYSLGLGVPFVLSGLALARLSRVFAWVKRHYRVLNIVAGLMLAAFGWLLLTNNVGWLSARISELLDAIGLRRFTSI
jgi:cytochrome c-type biogenesis protein